MQHRIPPRVHPPGPGVASIFRRSLAPLLLVLLGPSLAGAADLLGELPLTVDDTARVTTSPRPRDGRWSLTTSGDPGAVTRGLERANHPSVVSWTTHPEGRGARVELRLRHGVLGVAVERPTPERLVLQFFDGPHPVLPPTAPSTVGGVLRRPLPTHEPPEVLGLVWAVGRQSPVRPSTARPSPPPPLGSVPASVRGAWRADHRLGNAVNRAVAGDVRAAAEALSTTAAADAPSEAALALARAFVWSRPDHVGRALHPTWAADAYAAAVGLYPKADWAPWARGRAAALLLEARLPADAALQTTLARAAAPDHPERPQWDVLEGWARLAAGAPEAALARFRAAVPDLPSLDDGLRFNARIGVVRALWEADDPVRASHMLELVAREHPARAAERSLAPWFARVHLDGGRPAPAAAYVERLVADGERLDRERARWWRHEVALLADDPRGAAEALHDLVRATPGSVLAPLARVRLAVLDAARRPDRLGDDGAEASPPWAEVSLDLRRVALQFPRSPLEHDALLLVAQLWASDGMLGDALDLLHWLETRTAGPHPLVAELLGRWTPLHVDQLLRMDRPVEALARDRRADAEPTYRRGRSAALEDRLVTAAADVGLVGNAIRRMGVLLARGGSAETVDARLRRLVELQRAAGRGEEAAETHALLVERGVAQAVIQASTKPTPPADPDDARAQWRREEEADAAFQEALDRLLDPSTLEAAADRRNADEDTERRGEVSTIPSGRPADTTGDPGSPTPTASRSSTGSDEPARPWQSSAAKESSR